jgi:hypothetical protein
MPKRCRNAVLNALVDVKPLSWATFVIVHER